MVGDAKQEFRLSKLFAEYKLKARTHFSEDFLMVALKGFLSFLLYYLNWVWHFVFQD